MTNTFTFTDDQLHWLRVAVEGTKEQAQGVIEQGIDDDDVRDGMMLVDKYNELLSLIGEPPPIQLT